jgi:uncharacterized protein (DUF433 family)
VGELAGGMTIEKVMREYEISEEHMLAALDYAAEIIDAEQFYNC